MSRLVFACIAPNGSMIIPLLNEEGAQQALVTRAAMEELGRRMAAAQPETIVLITPHGHRVDGAFSLLNNQRVRGDLSSEEQASGGGFTVVFEVDKELNAAIVEAAQELQVPVTRIGYAVPDHPPFCHPLPFAPSLP